MKSTFILNSVKQTLNLFGIGKVKGMKYTYILDSVKKNS
jgi:hypothetical protein